MKFLFPKFLALCCVLAAGSGAYCLLSGGETVASAAEEMPQGVMVSSVQTDASGNEVQINILQTADGEYALADSVRQIYVYDMRNNTSAELKELYTSETGKFDDPYAVNAYVAAVRCYDFYADPQNLGTSIVGVKRENGQVPVHVLLHYGYSFANASYSYDEDKEVVYLQVGDGNPLGDLFNTALATDVLAHEYQHAITDMTAGLVYLNQSGAISEAISDVMGALIEGHELTEKEFWQTGEDAAPEGKDPMRSAIAPSEIYRLNAAANLYPECHREHTHESCDYGGVHYNSTVLTHMQYNLWRKQKDYFTRQRIGALWYATLCKLTPNATLKEFADCFLSAANDLKFEERAIKAIEEALFESGITATAEDNYHMVIFYQNIVDIQPNAPAVEEVCVRDGESAPTPEPPEDVITPRYIYTFIRWQGSIECVTHDVLSRADYTRTDRLYTVRFEDEDGRFLSERQYLYGEEVTPPEAYPKVGDEMYVYFFLGWDHPLDAVTENFTARPVYGREYRMYEATFLSDGKVFCRTAVHYNAFLELPDLTGKTRSSGERFEGWYLDEGCTHPAETVNVTKPITLYAKWVENEESEQAPTQDITVPLIGACVPVGLILVGIAAGLIVHKKKKK